MNLTREKVHRWWDKFSDYAIVVLALALIAALIFGVYNSQIAKDQSAIAKQNSAATKALAIRSLNSQNNHHAESIKDDAQLAAAFNEVKQSAAVIEYEGGVIAYQNGEIIAAQKAGHDTLEVIQALQQELNVLVPQTGTALKAGQAQINAYLGYLTCLATNPSNQAVCGKAPPLPSTG